MTVDIWLISDLHFSHNNIIKFLSKNPEKKGQLMRPGFRDIHHHNQHLCDRINSVVKPQDHVWHGGDFGKPEILQNLNGKWRNILGNHDEFKYMRKVTRFEKIEAWRRWNIDGVKFVQTHFPIYMSLWNPKDSSDPANPESRSYLFNVHGHLHDLIIRKENGQPDPRYLNISVECLKDYTPVHIEEIAKTLKVRK